MRSAMLVVDGVPAREILLADRFGDRLRGLIGRPAGTAMLIPGSSVHGWGMARAVRVVGIGPDGRVIAASVLAPSRLRRIAGATRILELPLTDPAPALGAEVRLDLGCGRCPDV